jgi:hypothetical protein
MKHLERELSHVDVVSRGVIGVDELGEGSGKVVIPIMSERKILLPKCRHLDMAPR